MEKRETYAASFLSSPVILSYLQADDELVKGGHDGEAVWWVWVCERRFWRTLGRTWLLAGWVCCHLLATPHTHPIPTVPAVRTRVRLRDAWVGEGRPRRGGIECEVRGEVWSVHAKKRVNRGKVFLVKVDCQSEFALRKLASPARARAPGQRADASSTLQTPHTPHTMPPKKKGDLQQKSPAEFFAENKNIAGFDNVSFDAAQPPACSVPPSPHAHILSLSLSLCTPVHRLAGQMLVHLYAGAGRKFAGRGGIHQRAAGH
jgi:hypothetical protein